MCQGGIDGVRVYRNRFFKFSDAVGGFVACFDKTFPPGRDGIAGPVGGSTSARGVYLLNEEYLIAGVGEGVSVRCEFDGFRHLSKVV